MLTFALLVSAATIAVSPDIIESHVQFRPVRGGFGLVRGGTPAIVETDSSDWPGVTRAAHDLAKDLQRVAQAPPPSQNRLKPGRIVIGTVGKSPTIDRLISEGKLDVSSIRGKWEASVTQVIGEDLVVAGADKRGTIFAAYDLSRASGVSPWNWWADVPVKLHSDVSFKGRLVTPSPTVKYRGIFLNDEAPGLSNWVRENYGEYKHPFYEKVFELLLRLKANYLWPAMWNNCFNEDDPLNPKLADEYGIVMGTSHVEPMMRADKEWNRLGYSEKQWNYAKYPKELEKFWADGVERNKPYESLTTIAMRGKIDTPMSEEANIELLEKIVAAQRKILAEKVNPDVTKIPQLWALYKEVQEYYEKGMRVPDDVTLLWCDDNWGNIRRLPTPEERKRVGGAGVYYHFDYVGDPRNYKWINTNPLPKIWEQMSLAHQMGANQIWIVNVGDLKPMEFPLEFFLKLAWNPEAITKEAVPAYHRDWAAREFGSEHAEEIGHLLAAYGKINGRRKPELIEAGTYSVTNYQEADRLVAEYNGLVARAKKVRDELPAEYRPAFFELVLHPIEASATVNELYVEVAKNRLAASQGRAITAKHAANAEALFKRDSEITKEYHTLLGGKWNHMMDQTHIGYTSWQQPDTNVMPTLLLAIATKAVNVGRLVEGESLATALPTIDSINRQSRAVTLFNSGNKKTPYTATASAPWIVIDAPAGSIEGEKQIHISVDFSKLPATSAVGIVNLQTEDGNLEPVQVIAEKLKLPSKPKGFLECDGVIAIEPHHYDSIRASAGAKWEVIPDYGRTSSGLAVFPVTTPSQEPGKGPMVEYGISLLHGGTINVDVVIGPTLNYVPGRGLRLAVSIDGGTPQVVDTMADRGRNAWAAGVSDNAKHVRTKHEGLSSGYHSVRVWMVDPGVVIQRLIIDCGGLKPSYLGPVESQRFK